MDKKAEERPRKEANAEPFRVRPQGPKDLLKPIISRAGGKKRKNSAGVGGSLGRVRKEGLGENIRTG